MTIQNDAKKILIVYASQTGQSKVIAETINDLALENGFQPKLYCISKFDKEFDLKSMQEPLILVCSTTGDGELPETSRKFYTKLRKLDVKEQENYLSNLNFALLGLGDSNYTNFASGPKTFYKKFIELGAKCFYGPFYADDGVGLELEVEPFKDGLWDALDTYFASKANEEVNNVFTKLTLKTETLGLNELTLPELNEKHLYVEEKSECSTHIDESDLVKLISNVYSQSNLGIFKASVAQNSIVSNDELVKKRHSLQFNLNGCFDDINGTLNKNLNLFDYEPGDAIDIVCPNDQIEVNKLLKRLKINDPTKCFQIKSNNISKKLGASYVSLTEKVPISYETFFTYCVDIRNSSLKKNFLRMLSSYCENKEDENRLLELSSKEGSDQYLKMIKEDSLSLLDLLNIFESCQPPIDHLIQMLVPLALRSYTLCSFDKKEMEIVFSLIKFDCESNRTYERFGIGTNYLSKLKTNESFYFLKRKFQSFTFPSSSSNEPLIMIGPGTGIAPFISYLRSIRVSDINEKSRKLWLFYGCRHPNKDFLFKKEILDEHSPKLSKLSLSFSQFTINDDENLSQIDSNILNNHVKNSKYVQDSLKYYSNEIANLIKEANAMILICGDAKNMSKDVFNCFVDILSQEYGMDKVEANKYLLEMMKNKRYKQDIWA